MEHAADTPPALESTRAPRETSPPSPGGHQRAGDERRRQVRLAETRLLYENAPTGIAATIIVAILLACAQWDAVPRFRVTAWLLYTLLVSAGRFALMRRYWRALPTAAENSRWNTAFVAGAALSAAGWAVGTIVLYPGDRPINEFLVVYSIGGVMLGSASLLAARPEAFLTFLLPTGLLSAIHLASEGDQDHLILGFLAAVFTVVTIITTWRFHRAIESSFKLRFDNQDLIGSLQTAKDAAESLNRELELRVRDRTARLLEADQRKDEFLATLAHELRNPLAPIRFALEAWKSDTVSSAAGRARDVIDRQVKQLVRLVDDLLDVSRITANKIQLRCEPLDLSRLMTTAVESITPLAAAADHTLDVRLPSTPLYVNGDGARLIQVFANVLNNAVKFTPPGGHIRFSAEPDAGEAVVRIRDTGTGIAPEFLPRVFDMFHQAEPVLERTTGGLGIGLTLARRLVEMHEGRIAIRSEGVGYGTEVEIRLRLTEARAGTAVAAEQSAPTAWRQLRVLIAEDNVDAAEMMALAVSTLGHVTRLAHDGAAAISAAREFLPDVVFLDIGLPVKNGYEVAQALRALPQFADIHIAAVTGWGQEEDRRKAREAGCDSHFTKPLSPATLEELLATIAERQPNVVDVLSKPRTRLADSNNAL